MQPLTIALIAANVLVYLLSLVAGWPAVAGYALWPLASGHFAPWQALSYAFVHTTPGHLLFNMWGLWMFGRELEYLWGPRRLAIFYLVCVLTAAATQLLVTASLGMLAPTIGASGGLFGLMAGFAREHPHEKIVPLIPPIPMPVWVFVVLYGALELVLGVTGTANGVAHFAHLGGLLGGLLCLLLWPHRPRPPAVPGR